jgi:septum formation protein
VSDLLILASASPRRAELLSSAGFEFEVLPADVDETMAPGELAPTYVMRVAELKARAVAGRTPGRWVLAADTAVVRDQDILGKPRNQSEARAMLRMLSGRTHEVLTGVCLWRGDRTPTVRMSRTLVEFAPLTDDEIDWYVASGEPADKAGGYAVQGLASRFVTRIEGSYSNVVGLPVALVYEMCRRAGLLLS